MVETYESQEGSSAHSLSGARVVITAGGTGGHVFPALAVAAELNQFGCEIHWLGTAHGLEAQVVPREGYELHCLRVSGIRGKGLRKKILALGVMFSATWQAILLLRKLNPSAVFGLGGYVTGPVGIAAWLLRKPLVIHEQNAIAGLTNRLLARLSRKVLVAFPEAFGRSGSMEVVCVGNPIRKNITQIMKPQQRLDRQDHFIRLLVVGGSLGASAINRVMPSAMRLLKEALADSGLELDLWHQCGTATLESTCHDYAELAMAYKIEAFIDNMAAAYEWADVIICRAGALTVYEVAAVGIPALFIPFPHAVDDHQTENARYLVQAGAAELLPEGELTAEHLVQRLKPMVMSKALRIKMAENGRSVMQFDAVDAVTQQLLEVLPC